MKKRQFAATGRAVSEVGLGTWQLGGTEWGAVDESRAEAILQAAWDADIGFIDTADIYGGGLSERRIGAFLRRQATSSAAARQRAEGVFIATKLGRGSSPGGAENLTYANLRLHTEQSLERLGRPIDLTQTHCIDHARMQEGSVFGHLRRLQAEGLIRSFGASVESVAEGLTCLEVDGLSSLQVIFNAFRRKPAEELFELAQKRNVAIIVRLPLASGLLGGKLTSSSTFASTDHRSYNRDGKAFNVGETFAGLGFERGLELAERVKSWMPEGATVAQFAIRFCLDFPAVTTVIPGASKPAQVTETAQASEQAALTPATHAELERFYRQEVRPWVRGSY